MSQKKDQNSLDKYKIIFSFVWVVFLSGLMIYISKTKNDRYKNEMYQEFLKVGKQNTSQIPSNEESGPNTLQTTSSEFDQQIDKMLKEQMLAFQFSGNIYMDASEGPHVSAKVHERDMGLIEVGSKIKITAADLPHQTFKGRITEIIPYIDPETQMVGIEAIIDDPDHKLKAGVSVSGGLIH